jgi:shikimate dehydrogenase
MKLALLGHPVSHSLSPKLYKEMLGPALETYELIDAPSSIDVPSLESLATRFHGLNITSPYKKHFLEQITVIPEMVKALKSVNTLSFTSDGVLGTNTDSLAVRRILTEYKEQYGDIDLVILGSGSMAHMTELIAQELKVPYQSYARRSHGDISKLDLSSLKEESQTIVINSCSRDFVFEGILHRNHIFWDYNYSFAPHEDRIPALVKTYQDGQRMLRLQAEEAIRFWKETNPKLNL